MCMGSLDSNNNNNNININKAVATMVCASDSPSLTGVLTKILGEQQEQQEPLVSKVCRLPTPSGGGQFKLGRRKGTKGG